MIIQRKRMIKKMTFLYKFCHNKQATLFHIQFLNRIPLSERRTFLQSSEIEI